MAISVRVCGPRDVYLAVETVDGQACDDAIDLEKSDLQGYSDSLFLDKSKIALIDGEKPSVFTIRPMLQKQKVESYSFFPQEITESQQTARDFFNWSLFVVRCGLRGFSNFYHVGDSGERKEPPDIEVVQSGSLGEMATAESIAALELPQVIQMGIASMISRISEAQAPLLKP